MKKLPNQTATPGTQIQFNQLLIFILQIQAQE